MSEHEIEKYDPSLLELVESSTQDAQISLILGLAVPADNALVSELKQSGLDVQSVIGDIITGHCQIKHLSAIAGLEYVLKVEASREMDIESHEHILE